MACCWGDSCWKSQRARAMWTESFSTCNCCAKVLHLGAIWSEKLSYDHYRASDAPGLPKDLNRALETLRSLASRGHPTSQYVLGLRYFSSSQSSDVNSGLKLIEKAANSGLVQASTQLG